MSVVLLTRVQEFGGDAAVQELLRRAGSPRTVGYLTDIGNWISYDEAIALWRAGAEVTHHPAFARVVGEDAAVRLSGSPVASLLRSLGSPEAVYRQIAVTATKYTVARTLEALRCEPGHAEIVARTTPGFPCDAEVCEWNQGLLSTTTLLFGLPPATIEHDSCAAHGAAACHYHVRWPVAPARSPGEPPRELDRLREQLDAMTERLHSMFETAAELIGAGDVDDVLERIADRAAIEVRAPRHLLAVRMTPDGPLHCHQQGFAADEATRIADTLASGDLTGLPGSWVAVPIRSSRRDYGHLLAAYAEREGFFSEERELLEVYARYAASALDGATALQEAESRYRQSSALLALARELSLAGTSSEVARRLADSVQVVVDCDQVAVYVWDGAELVREAVTAHPDSPPPAAELAVWTPRPGTTLQALVDHPRPDPIFIDPATSESEHAKRLRGLGFQASIIVPLVSSDALLGVLAVAVRSGPERLAPTPDLLDRLSGVGAQAATALQNGRLVDLITYQALHDQLTGLANRAQFSTELRAAVGRASVTEELACVFYIDLDRFKPVNDELGHDVGDELLVAVAERLRSCTRAEDIVARLGGDEFAVLVVARNAADIDAVQGRLAAGFDDPFEMGGKPLSVAVSIGRSIYPADAPDADGLLRRADAAMFADKRGRRRTDDPAAPASAPASASA